MYWLLLLLMATPEAATGPFSIHPCTLAWKVTAAEPPARPMQEQWARGALVMPYVSGGEPSAAERINQALFLDVLGAAAPESGGARFRLPAGAVPESFASLAFTVERNDARMLALRVDSEACGAYCEEGSTHYAFATGTGRQIRTEDILARPGLGTVASRMRLERIRRYSAQIARLRQDLKALRAQRKASQELVADAEERIALNQECLARAREEQDEKGGRLAETTLGFDVSLAESGSLVFRAGRCSNHASRALDDVGDLSLAIPLADLSELLSPYGKALLLAEGDAPPPANLFGQVLRGKVGRRTITMRLDRPYHDGSVAGSYFYDKFRKTIRLSGRRRGRAVELSEQDSGGTFTLTEKSGRLVGTWAADGRSVPVEAHW